MALGTLHSFPMHRGDDRDLTFTVVDEAAAAVDITGATLTWVLANQDPKITGSPAPRGSALVTKTVGSGITITDAVAGEGTVSILPADTTGLKAPASYYYELQVVLSGKTTTILFGNITLSRDLIVPGP